MPLVGNTILLETGSQLPSEVLSIVVACEDRLQLSLSCTILYTSDNFWNEQYDIPAQQCSCVCALTQD